MHSTDQRTTEIARILVERAPCFFCGYNGAGFFQPGTHAGSCPWAGVGGDDARYAVLPTVLSDLLSRLRTVEEERDEALPYMRAIQNRHNGYGAGVPGVYEPRSPKEALDALLEEAEAMGRLESVADLRVAEAERDRLREQRDALVGHLENVLSELGSDEKYMDSPEAARVYLARIRAEGTEPTPHLSLAGLSAAQVADIEAHVRGLSDGEDGYPAPAHGWTCFHCGETFRTAKGARLHFGETPAAVPVCAEGPEPGPTRESNPGTVVQGVVFILVRDGCVLMERCPKKAARHGAEWFIPGGRIEAGETREAALLREMAEELGCTPGVFVPLPLADACGGPGWPTFLMQPYVVTHWVGDVPETCLDHPDVPLRWVPWSEALASPSDVVREMLTAAHSLLAQLGRKVGG